MMWVVESAPVAAGAFSLSGAASELTWLAVSGAACKPAVYGLPSVAQVLADADCLRPEALVTPGIECPNRNL